MRSTPTVRKPETAFICPDLRIVYAR